MRSVRFTIRRLLGLVAACALVLFGTLERRLWQHEIAFGTIERLDGQILAGDELDRWWCVGRYGQLAWTIRELDLGSDACGDTTRTLAGVEIEKIMCLDLLGLELDCSRLDPRAVEMIGRMRTLESLRCAGTNLTDEDMKSIGRLTRLEYLDLSCTPVTDGGLRHLECLRRLRYLCLTGTSVSNEGISALKLRLPNLELCVFDPRSRVQILNDRLTTEGD